MDDVFVYIVHLPYGIKEMVAPCFGGYTIYISDTLTMQGRRNAYLHAIKHIERGDFENINLPVQQIEWEAHRD